MAGRILNRRELRKQAEQTEVVASGGESPSEKKAKVPAAAKAKKPRKQKAPPRMCARWAVFDGGMKQVAIFDYSERAAADKKLADLLAKKKGVHFLQIVKEPMPEPAPAEEVSVG